MRSARNDKRAFVEGLADKTQQAAAWEDMSAVYK